MRWRRFGAERPSLAASVEACQAGLNFDVYAQLLAQQAGTGTPRKPDAQKRPPKGDAPPQPRSDKPPRGGSGDNAVYKSVPDIPSDKFLDATTALGAAHPGVCRSYLLTKKGCFRAGSCKFKHEAPQGFAELIKKALGK